MTIIAKNHHRRPCTIGELVDGGEVQPFTPSQATKLGYQPVTDALDIRKIPQSAEISDCEIYENMVVNYTRPTNGGTPDVVTVKVGPDRYELWRKSAECNPFITRVKADRKTDVVVLIR